MKHARARLPWICPECNRPFKHKNQAHSCVRIEEAVHLENKSPATRLIYDRLREAVRKFGDVKTSGTKSSIMFVSRSTFLAVKPKRGWIDIEFLLDKEVTDYPVYKTFRSNKSRVAHFVRLQSPKDVSTKLIGLLKRSYEVTNEA